MKANEREGFVKKTIAMFFLFFGLGSASLFANSAFLPEEGEGTWTIKSSFAEWDELILMVGSKPVDFTPETFGFESPAREYSVLFALNYGWRSWALDLEAGYVQSNLKGTLVEKNDGLSDVQLGISRSLYSPWEEGGWFGNAPFFLVARLGVQISGSYDTKPRVPLVLNLPGRGNDTINLGLFAAKLFREGRTVLSGDGIYHIGVGSDPLNFYVIGLTLTQMLTDRLSIFGAVRREEASRGYADAPEMESNIPKDGGAFIAHFEEEYNVGYIGAAMGFPFGDVSLSFGKKWEPQNSKDPNIIVNATLSRFF